MKKVCLYYWHRVQDFDDYAIEHFDPNDHIGSRDVLSLRDLIVDGWGGYSKRREIGRASCRERV